MALLPTTVLNLRRREILTEGVVAHPITLSPFSIGFFTVTGTNQFTSAKLESTLRDKASRVHIQN